MAVGFVDEKLEHIIFYYFVSQFLAIYMKQIGWYDKVILGAYLFIMRICTEFGFMSFDEDPNAHHMAASLCINENCLQMLLVSMKQRRTTMNLWYHHDNESSSSVTGKRFLWSLRTSWCMLTNIYLKCTFCTSICRAQKVERLKIKAALVLFLICSPRLPITVATSSICEFTGMKEQTFIQLYADIAFKLNILISFSRNQRKSVIASYYFKVTLSRLRRVHAPTVTQAERSNRS